MERRRINPVLAWICLIVFGVTSTLFSGGVVACSDGHGGTRVEWGCSRNLVGECASRCGPDREKPGEDHGPAHPCDDAPIRGDHPVTKAHPRTTNDVPMPVPAVLAVIGTPAAAPAAPGFASARARPQRPPDTLRRLRSVIRVV